MGHGPLGSQQRELEGKSHCHSREIRTEPLAVHHIQGNRRRHPNRLFATSCASNLGQVRIFSQNDNGKWNPSKPLEYVARTEPTRPEPPSNIRLTPFETWVHLQWMPPYPPTGKVRAIVKELALQCDCSHGRQRHAGGEVHSSLWTEALGRPERNQPRRSVEKIVLSACHQRIVRQFGSRGRVLGSHRPRARH